MKTKTVLILSIIIAILLASSGFLFLQLKAERHTTSQLIGVVADLNDNISALTKQQAEFLKQRTYQISLSPNVNTSAKATFGKVNNIHFQYYFSLDGKINEIKPDSTYTYVK